MKNVLTARHALPEKFTRVLVESDLPVGEMKRVHYHDAPLLLVKHDARVCALVEKCAHPGGRWAQGSFEGDTVVCPWHSTRSALESGASSMDPRRLSSHVLKCGSAMARSKCESSVPETSVKAALTRVMGMRADRKSTEQGPLAAVWPQGMSEDRADGVSGSRMLAALTRRRRELVVRQHKETHESTPSRADLADPGRQRSVQ